MKSNKGPDWTRIFNTLSDQLSVVIIASIMAFCIAMTIILVVVRVSMNLVFGDSYEVKEINP